MTHFFPLMRFSTRRSLSLTVRATLALLLAAIAAFASVRSASANEEHIVRPGETLSQIAARYGTTVARLRQLNNLTNVNYVWYGQRLLIDGTTPNSSTNANQNRGGVATYRVRPGDSLSKIARRYGISLTELARMNNLSPFRWLYTGQALRVPGSAPGGQAAQGQSPQAGATNQNASGVQSYTVQAGDSLSRIARRYGISVTELARMNNLSAIRWLYTGQVLRVPMPAPELPAAPVPAPEVQPALPPTEVHLVQTEVVSHLVQPGELLSQIADRYGIPAAVLARINRLPNPNVVEEGQVLRIPSPDALELLEGSFARLHPSQYPTQTERWIEVDLSEQLAVAYEGTIPIRAFVISSGVGSTPTVTGTFRIWAKIAMQDMSGGSRASGTYYHLKDVRNVQYFFKNYAIHGTYWHSNFGSPMSRGCVNMTEEDAAWLFEWTSPAVHNDDWLFSDRTNPGTLVMVHQ